LEKNMRKILVSLLAVSASSAFAWDYSQFQAFDNQISIGYGMQQQSTTALGGGNNLVSSSNLVNLEGERLLNNGVWVDLNADMVFGQGQTSSNTVGGLQQQQEPIQSNYGFNGKVGYGFPVAGQHLLITPYGLAGLNNNGIAGDYTTGTNAQGASTTTANQFYYTGGVGGRLEYRINHAIEVYADQSAAYNWDQTGYSGGIQPQNFYAYTSTLGAKFNIVKDFQLGVRGFYQNNQFDSSSGTPSGSSQLGFAYPQAQTSVGGLVTIGLTY
jgi:hypothetical protein